MFKKMIIFVVALLVLLLGYVAFVARLPLTGSGNSGYLVYVVLQGRGTGFWDAVENGALSARGMKKSNVVVEGPQSETDFAQQVKLIDGAIAAKANALVIAPQNTAAVVEAIKRAQNAGIKVVMIDNYVETGSDIPLVTSDNSAIGKVAAEGILKSGRVKKAVIIRGVWGDDSQDLRAGTAMRALKDAGVEVVACESADSSRDKAQTIVQNILQQHPDIDAIFATNDDMAIGAADAELKSGYVNPVYIVGVDATPDGVKAIENGKIDATVSQEAFEIGRLGVVIALDMLNRKAVKNVTIVPSELLTKSDIVLK